MQEIKGLNDLYKLYKNALDRDQDYLDPKHDEKKHPKDFAIFLYGLSFKEYYVRGDTKRIAMENFCRLYEKKGEKRISNLLDPDILRVEKKSLRLAGVDKAEGLYFVLKSK